MSCLCRFDVVTITYINNTALAAGNMAVRTAFAAAGTGDTAAGVARIAAVDSTAAAVAGIAAAGSTVAADGWPWGQARRRSLSPAGLSLAAR